MEKTNSPSKKSSLSAENNPRNFNSREKRLIKNYPQSGRLSRQSRPENPLREDFSNNNEENLNAENNAAEQQQQTNAAQAAIINNRQAQQKAKFRQAGLMKQKIRMALKKELVKKAAKKIATRYLAAAGCGGCGGCAFLLLKITILLGIIVAAVKVLKMFGL